MKKASVVLVIVVLFLSTVAGASSLKEGLGVSADAARQRLIDGNKRYLDAKMSHPDQTVQRRNEIAKGQHPFAVIVACSDSRVPPEIIFDQGLGDLFVIRLAGNILDDAAVGSIEYAVDHLGARYIMVLGHKRCGAVEATVKGGEAPGHVSSLIKAIRPTVEKVKNLPGDPVDNAVRANVALAVQQLKSSGPILVELVKKGNLAIDGGYYDLDDGKIIIAR